MIYCRIHTIKGCIERQFLHPCLPEIWFIWQCEAMTLPIFQRIRYWTAAAKNICHFCKLLFTLESYKTGQVHYCIHVPSLFAHFHAHIHTWMQILPWLMIALSMTVQSQRLCKFIPLKQSVLGFLAWHNQSIKRRLLLGPEQAKLGNVLL